MNMKGKLRSESLPSAIYDAIVIHAANCGRLGVGRNENVSRKTHSSPLSLSRWLSKCFSAPAVRGDAHADFNPLRGQV